MRSDPWWVYVIVYTVVGSWWGYLFHANQRRDTLSKTAQTERGKHDDHHGEPGT